MDKSKSTTDEVASGPKRSTTRLEGEASKLCRALIGLLEDYEAVRRTVSERDPELAGEIWSGFDRHTFTADQVRTILGSALGEPECAPTTAFLGRLLAIEGTVPEVTP